MSSQVVRRWLILLALALLLTASGGTLNIDPNTGTLRGAAFLDSNRNGVMDAGEPGVGGVYFTISAGDYSHTYYTEPRTVDEFGNTYATGTFGPIPLPRGDWHVTLHVPAGYRATTPIEQTIYVPGAEGGHVGWVYFGLTDGRAGLPPAGATLDPLVVGGLVLLGLGGLAALGFGALARKRT